MFYCIDCAEKNEWPITNGQSHGKCEICEKYAYCSEVPSSELPTKNRIMPHIIESEGDKKPAKIILKPIMMEIHENNKNKGFFDEPKNIGEMLALVHSEVSEALECDRKDKFAKLDRFEEIVPTINDEYEEKSKDETWKELFEKYIKDSWEDELADVVIRVLDLAEFTGVDLEKHIELKMKYNSLRPYKHGKKY
jgi:NTP pyrophosphatase (non-canonical NTP hydrolase)